MAKLKVICSECGKKELVYLDLHDIRTARWTILGSSLNTMLPIVLCDTCELSLPGRPAVKKEKKKRSRFSEVAEMEQLV